MLVYNVVFAPSTTLKQTVSLLVKAATGGVWRFPVTFLADEPEPDDVIELEAVGLNKECAVAFRLSSQDRSVSRFPYLW